MTTVPANPAATPPRDGIGVPVSALVMTGLLTAGLLGLFFRWFWTQHKHSWGALEDWGHAYFIPAISGYLIYQHRERIRATASRVFWPGLAPFLLGIMCYFFCVVQVRNHMLQGFSIVLCIFGLVLLMLGPRMMRWLFVPIAYLGFMVTISTAIMIAVTFKLQLIASQGAWLMLNMVGKPFGWFSAEVDGNTLTVVTRAGELFPLNVAEACSGMRMVVAFYALAGAVALIGCRHWWQRILLVLLAGPVAVFMNIVRVAVLGVLTLIDPNLAAGDAHTIIGTILLVPSLGLFLGIVWALNRVVREDEPAAKVAKA
jgi:eight transmembrane protein EpsH (proposed exosortase)